MFRLINNLRNAVDYPLRQLFRWRRGGLNLSYQSKKELFPALEETEKEKLSKLAGRYLEQYKLDWIRQNSNKRIYRQNLYYLDLLVTTFEKSALKLPHELLAVDIGVSDWFYVQVLYAFLQNWQAKEPRKILLEGYEMDAYRVYADLYSRMDYALAYSENLENVDFYPRAFEKKNNVYDLVFMFFPFILECEHLRWGLPLKHYDPILLLRAAWESLKPEGYLMIVNQGLEEAEVQAGLVKELGLDVPKRLEYDSAFYSYDLKRYVFLLEK